MLLEVKNLSVDFGKKKKILDKVSFTVEEGEIISLIGLNGTGKTTLLKAIIGLVKPSAGSVKKHVDDIFYIPQRSDLDTSFPLTVREFCELFGAEGYEQYLTETGMKKHLKKHVGNLSGGEYQRVLVAIALSRKPELLLLDEPTAGIDVSGEEAFYKLLSEIRDKYGMSMILVSHNIHLVIKNADKVLCLAGHLCCTGTPAEVEKDKEFQVLFGKHLTPYVHKHDHVH